ncbi:hypothetical protein PALB_26440 [Pseudoalteromonas luteoviolacea B = ATCC 29581]|nr:hypothetical protein PALB_26440 [Pseudoalteromonas luteoviolacea B = ATCC 29581]
MISKAIHAFQKKQFDLALSLLTQQCERSPEKYHLLTLVLESLNRIEKAFESICEGVNNFPNDQRLIYQLCQFGKKHGVSLAAAELIKKQNCAVLSNEVAYAYLSLLIDCQLLQRALAFDELLSSSLKQTTNYYWYLCELHKQIADHRKALDTAKIAVTIFPDDFHLNYRLASLLQEMGKAHEALPIYQTLLKLQPKNPDLNYAIACAYHSIQDLSQTEQYLIRVLELAPNYVPAHESYTKLMWEQNRNNDYLKTYSRSRELVGLHPQVLHSEVGQLLKFDKLDAAIELSSQALKQFPTIPEIQHMQSILLDKRGNTEASIAILEKLVQTYPYHSRFSLDLANHYLVNGELHKADLLLQKPLQADPHNQELWAYQSIAWKLLNDDRFAWLNDYNKIVGQFMLPTPKGYNSLSSFLSELQSTLLTLHEKEKKQPLDQSVRIGTQTDGHLLLLENKVIQAFKWAYNECILKYFASFPTDLNHPLYRRHTGLFKTNGSWSVQLQQGGFHTNHIHPRGWISGPAYIKIPENMYANDEQRSGWLKLGETCLGLGEKESVDLALCPEEGMVIFFPSYLWHGTYTLTSSSPRMTIPCDILPIT